MKANNHSHWLLQQVAEDYAPRTSIHLWPGIESRAVLKVSEGGHTPKHSIVSLRTAIGVFLLVVLVVSLGSVPAVRAWAEDVIQRMGIAFVNPDLVDSHAQIVKVDATIESNPPESLTIEEAREQIPFAVMLPTWLPEGLSYARITISEYDTQTWQGSGKQISISYSRSETSDFNSGMLFLHANDGPISAPPLLAESQQQDVTVNGQPGYYVHGGWQDDGRGDPNIKMGVLQWDSQADDAYLTWTQDGVTYLLEAHNLGLEADDLLRIAESFRY